MQPVLQRLKRCADALGVALFTAMFGVFLVQIVARFGFNRPLPWTDELAVALYVWVILWASAAIVPEREQVVFDLVWNGVGRSARRVMRIAGALMIGGLAAAALPACWDYVAFMRREATPVLDIPFMVVFAPFIALLLAMVIRSAWAIAQALRGQGLEEAGLPNA